MEPPTLPNVQGHSSKRRWKSFACYVPLATIGLQVVWVLLVFVALIFTVGDTPHRITSTNQHLFEIIGALPAMAGSIFGVIAMACRWPQDSLDRVEGSEWGQVNYWQSYLDGERMQMSGRFVEGSLALRADRRRQPLDPAGRT